MKYRLEYISTFHTDVLNLISDLEDYPLKAKRIIEKLDKKLLKLAGMPGMYQIYEDFPIFRKMSVDEYMVFYIINERDKTVELHRLIYGRMNIRKQLE